MNKLTAKQIYAKHWAKWVNETFKSDKEVLPEHCENEVGINQFQLDAMEEYINQEQSSPKEVPPLVNLLQERMKEYHKTCLQDTFINGRFWEVKEIIELVLSKLKAEEPKEGEVAEKVFKDMLEKKPMKLVSYMLLVIARDLAKANSATTTIKQDMNMFDKRYTVSCKIEIKEINNITKQ